MRILRFEEFLNENKIYSNLKQITDKLNGDETTENKVVIMGLFRENPNFKGVDPLKITLEELNTRYKKQFNETLDRLKVSFKGNDDMVEQYLNAYCDNIKSLGNKATPFSYKDPEKTLIDVVNNNQQIKGNPNEKLIGIDNIDKKDIVFEDDKIVIIYIPTQQHAIKYGRGQTQCIANPTLHYFPVYRISYKATIYYVLFKNKDSNDDKKLCAILRYSNVKQGIADKTNDGDFAGNNNYEFDDVVRILPDLKDRDGVLKYVELSDKEINMDAIARKFINKDDITSEIEKICNEHGFSKKEFFTSYVSKHDIMNQQFDYFTDDMQEFFVETGRRLSFNTKVIDNVYIRYLKIPDKFAKRYVKNNYEECLREFTDVFLLYENVNLKEYFNKFHAIKYNMNVDDLITAYIKKKDIKLSKNQFNNLDKKHRDLYFNINNQYIAYSTLCKLNNSDDKYNNEVTIDIKQLKDYVIKKPKINQFCMADDDDDDINYDPAYCSYNNTINNDMVIIYDNIIKKSHIYYECIFNSQNVNMQRAILLNIEKFKTIQPFVLMNIFYYNNSIGFDMALSNGLIRYIDARILHNICKQYGSIGLFLDMFKILLKYLNLNVINDNTYTNHLYDLKSATSLDILLYKLINDDVDIEIIELFIEHGAKMNNEYLLDELPQDKRKKIELLLEQ